MTGNSTGQGHMSVLMALYHLFCPESNAEMLLIDLLIDGGGESGDGGWITKSHGGEWQTRQLLEASELGSGCKICVLTWHLLVGWLWVSYLTALDFSCYFSKSYVNVYSRYIQRDYKSWILKIYHLLTKHFWAFTNKVNVGKIKNRVKLKQKANMV